jgi:hypothetical protein
VESILGPLGTSATTGLLYLPRVIVMMENLVEWRSAGETEVLGETLPQRHFVHLKSHLLDPGRRGGKPATNRLSYGTATAVIMKNDLFWDVVPCRSCVSRRFGRIHRLHLQGRKIRERGTSVSRCLQTATCSPWFLARGFSTLKMEMIRSSETSIHTRFTRLHIPEDGILQNIFNFSTICYVRIFFSTVRL